MQLSYNLPKIWSILKNLKKNYKTIKKHLKQNLIRYIISNAIRAQFSRQNNGLLIRMSLVRVQLPEPRISRVPAGTLFFLQIFLRCICDEKRPFLLCKSIKNYGSLILDFSQESAGHKQSGLIILLVFCKNQRYLLIYRQFLINHVLFLNIRPGLIYFWYEKRIGFTGFK